jgi:thioredoxin reductase
MYDAIIVGGGPAGLSAALLLGRCRRRVLVCDEGRPRNGSSWAMHGFLSRDGVAPGEFLRHAREQLAPYPVDLRDGRVVEAARAGDGFTVATAAGTRWTARALLLATGVRDRLPDIPGLRDLYGTSVFTCPYCDAWEVRGAPLAVHGAGGVGLACRLRAWSDDVVWLADGERVSAQEQAEATAAGVRVVVSELARLVGREGVLERVEFVDGHSLDRAALFLELSQAHAVDLAAQLGLPSDEVHGVHHGPRGATRVPGVWVAGDASCDTSLAIVAAAEGASAACAIHEALWREDMAALRRRASTVG